MLTKIQKNLSNVLKRIEDACERSGRNPSEVSLITVSKTIPPEIIKEAIDAGSTILGENRPQELRDKYPVFPDMRWHIIGHLQTNKIKYIVGKAELIHSVDSFRLAEEINSYAEKIGLVQDVLLEVNISGEESKYGLTLDEIPNIIKDMKNLKNISFKGFMTMAPKYAAEEEIRGIFKEAHNLFLKHKEDGASVLSMGMSGDFEIAVEEGATHVRVGSAIFK
ncbi:MAG: YggS family pyridoxal phosphate-dependent enzyme [Clostridia bacterium]|nr:YggS family pyridoxal phosphate-dependent enzyme [Clostridia bacterium]